MEILKIKPARSFDKAGFMVLRYFTFGNVTAIAYAKNQTNSDRLNNRIELLSQFLTSHLDKQGDSMELYCILSIKIYDLKYIAQRIRYP